MELTPLPEILIFLYITLVFLWWGLVIVFFCGVLWSRVSLALLLWWICRSRVSLVLLSKFLLDFDSIPIGRSKRRDVEEVHISLYVPM